MKKAICIVLCALFLIPAIIIPSNTEAATNLKKLSTISSFKTTLSYDQYNALRTGTITAVKQNGTWYYKFATKQYYVLVKASAFKGTTVSNDYSSLNEQLSAGLNSDLSRTPGYVVKKSGGVRADLSAPPTYSGHGRNRISKYPNCYYFYFSYYSFLSSRDNSNVILSCKRNGTVTFEYHEKVRKYSQRTDEFVSPSNADQFKRALRRTTAQNGSIQPIFEVEVKQPGEKKIFLKTFKYQVIGQEKTKKNIDKLVKVVYTTGSIVWNLKTKGLSAKTVYDLYKLCLDLKGERKLKVTPSAALSKTYKGKDYKVVKATFASPVWLEKGEDYFEVDVNLNNRPTLSGKKKTTFSVKFTG